MATSPLRSINNDHVPPPLGATPPDDSVGEYGFDFARFGPRVPTVLVSPLIAAGTLFRVAAGKTPLDHTSILKTVENRWELANLTARDAAAQDVSALLTLATPRTDERGGVHHTMPEMKTSQEYSEYIRLRTAAWKAAKHSNAGAARVR